MERQLVKAWQLEKFGGKLELKDIPTPEVRPGSVLVRIEASSLMSYLTVYVEGKLPTYRPPQGPFTPGGNGVGVVEAVGPDVWHLKPGQRVILSSHFVVSENVADKAQILLGVTHFGGIGEAVQADGPNGTLAEYALFPVTAVSPVDGLDQVEPRQLAVFSRCVVPYGGLVRGRLTAGETVVITGATGAYGTSAIAAMITPFFVGMIADRFFSTERLLFVLHIAGSAILYWLSGVLEPMVLYWGMIAYFLTYMPTLALTN